VERFPLRDINVYGATGCMVWVIVEGKGNTPLKLTTYPSCRQELVESYADALLVLKQAAQSASASEQARFEEVARSNRGAAANPVLPEEVLRLKVQAEGAVRDKQFEDAEMYYGRVIEAAPWWAEGYFNRAVVLAELQDFTEAITEMKRYLLLAPNAPNARTVQDSIYEWERKARASN
jgi:tetratricopeptide (TPR) repeat protein